MESGKTSDAVVATVTRGGGNEEGMHIAGIYEVDCLGPDGELKWRDRIVNLVTTVGKNLTLDTLLAGSAYTVTGPFMGLISSVSYTAIAAADTMASHGGWTEAGSTNAPTYTAPRKTVAFDAASAGSKAATAAQSFAITGAGTVKGCFIALGTGATSTILNTGGTLYSAGLFSGGDKVVDNGDTLNVTYSTNLNA